VGQSYYTTTQAAKLLSVSPDTVLKWVKANKLASYRTPGGHHRIPAEAVAALVPEGMLAAIPLENSRGYDHCWEFYAGEEGVRNECRDCVAYKSRARRCYEMRSIPEEFGHLRLFCRTECEDCRYYQLTHEQSRGVLVVSRNRTWLGELAGQTDTSELTLATAASEYACGAVIESFRPDFIVLDCSFGTRRTREICRHLNDDERIPFTRIVLTSRQPRWADACEQEVCGWIEKPFTMVQLDAFIEGAAHREAQGDTVA